MSRKANGSAIRDLREAVGISQTDLARRIGVTASQLSKVERGANGMSAPVLRKVADALGASLDSVSIPIVEADEPEPVAS